MPNGARRWSDDQKFVLEQLADHRERLRLLEQNDRAQDMKVAKWAGVAIAINSAISLLGVPIVLHLLFDRLGP